MCYNNSMNRVNQLKQKVLQAYYRTKFTVVELLVITVIIFWLTKKSILYIIELL
jgi:hypothetical protein